MFFIHLLMHKWMQSCIHVARRHMLTPQYILCMQHLEKQIVTMVVLYTIWNLSLGFLASQVRPALFLSCILFGYLHIYFHWHTSASAALSGSLKLGPSLVTSGIISAWLWRYPHVTVLNASHWSTLAWHCDWQSQSAYHGPGDGHTLIYRWDGDAMSMIDWQTVTEPLGRDKKPTSAQQGSHILLVDEGVRVGWCFCSSVYVWRCLQV